MEGVRVIILNGAVLIFSYFFDLKFYVASWLYEYFVGRFIVSSFCGRTSLV